MSTAYVIVTVLAALIVGSAAVTDVVRPDMIRGSMRNYGVPDWGLNPLGLIKAAGAAGLLVGLALPPIGLAAAIGLVLYFLLAELTVLRARCYRELVFPLPYLTLAAGSLALFALG